MSKPQAVDLEGATSSEENSREPGRGDGANSVECLRNYLCVIINFLDLESTPGFWCFVTAYVVVIFLHPLHYYAYVINEKQQCLEIDNQLHGTFFVVAIFNIYMLLYVPNVIRKFFAEDITKKRSSKLALLCLQTILPHLTRGTKDRIFLTTANLFLFGYMLLVIGLSITIAHASKNISGTIAHAKWSKAVFNLFLYLHGGHVFGAVWYCFSIDRVFACWKKAHLYKYGVLNPRSFVCDKNETNLSKNGSVSCEKIAEACQNMVAFGIFNDAVQSGIVDMKGFPKKFLYCFRWGLQALSCFGQNLQPSTFPVENIFVVSITIYSIVLFVFLIGNMQTYLQSEIQRPEKPKQKEDPSLLVQKQEVEPSMLLQKQEVEPSMFLQKREVEQSMSLQKQDAEQWMFCGKLSEKLQKEVKNFQQNGRRETKIVDVRSLFNTLPKDLIKKIKIELCLAQLKKVEEFQNWSDARLENLCDCVKPAFYVECTLIVREGDPITAMLFVLQGNLWTFASRGTDHGNTENDYLGDGDFFGEELITWVQADPHSSSFPISTRNIQALTNVDAFVLMAYDLKKIFIKYYQEQAEPEIILEKNNI